MLGARRTTAPLSPLRRGFAASSIALLCLLVQGAGIGHLLLARHVVCPMHGDLVHEDEAHLGSGTATQAPARSLSVVSSGHDRSEAEHQHEHCAVVSSRREQAVAPVSAQALPLPTASLIAILTVAPHAPHARPIYNLAPKQSPPV